MRCLNSSFSYFFLVAVVLCGGGCRLVESLVLLTPPGSHYGYYDASRNDLFDFYADFYRATALVGEPVVFVVTKGARPGVDEGSYKELVKRLEDHHNNNSTDSLSSSSSSSSSSFKDNVWLAWLDDIWVRDFFPTQLNDQTVAKFQYSPAYLDVITVGYINSATTRLLSSWEFPGLMDYNDLVMDGGGIVLDPDNSMAVLTERILRDNPFLAGRPLDETGLGPSSSCCLDDPYGLLLQHNNSNNVWFTDEEIAIGEATLASLLGYDTVAIVPEEPSAPRLGHIDGLCNWLAPGVLALSNFSDPSHYQEYQELLQEKLGDTVTIVPFPYVITNDAYFDGFESAFGIYVNFLRTKQALYLPVFGGKNSSSSNNNPQQQEQQERYGAIDELALEIARNYSDLPVVPVDASRVAIMGGSVRCLSQHLWGSTNADYLLQKVAAARAKDENNESASTSAAAAIVRLSPWQQLGSLVVAMVGFLF